MVTLAQVSVYDLHRLVQPFGQRRIMAYHDKRPPIFAREGHQIIYQPVGRRAIQARRRFVGKDHGRVMRKSARYRDPLPLTTGKARGEPPRCSTKPEPVQRRPRTLTNRRSLGRRRKARGKRRVRPGPYHRKRLADVRHCA